MPSLRKELKVKGFEDVGVIVWSRGENRLAHFELDFRHASKAVRRRWDKQRKTGKEPRAFTHDDFSITVFGTPYDLTELIERIYKARHVIVKKMAKAIDDAMPEEQIVKKKSKQKGFAF